MFAEFEFRILVPFAESQDVDPEISSVWSDLHTEIERTTTLQIRKKFFKPEFMEVVRFNQISESNGFSFIQYIAEVNVAFEIEIDLGADEGDGSAIQDMFSSMYYRAIDPLTVASRNLKDPKWTPWAKGWDPVSFQCELKGIQVTPVDFWGDYAEAAKSTEIYENIRKYCPVPQIYSGEEHY